VAVYATKRIVNSAIACNIVEDRERLYGYKVLKFSLTLVIAEKSCLQTRRCESSVIV
jgi:hypothetical protein